MRRILNVFVLIALAAPAYALELEDCRLDRGRHLGSVAGQCATLAVPENPDAPDARQIDLAVAVIPALNIESRPDPLFVIAGGPGQSSIEFYLALRGAFESVRLDRDIVLVDQRGTGKSNALVCREASQLAEPGLSREAMRDLTAACLAELDGDPRFYTTSVAVDDLDRVRVALGYDTINVYGVSYGTRVAQHFMRRYPNIARRVILDGVVHTELVLGPALSIDAQAALDSIFDRCAESPACGARFPNLPERYRELQARLEASPASVTIPDPETGLIIEQAVGAAELAGVVRLQSYSPATVALLPLIIETAWQGNLMPLAAQVRMVENQVQDLLAIGMHNAVVCTEDIPFLDTSAIDRSVLEATYLGTSLLDALVDMCAVWPAGVLDDDFKEPLASDIPVLLLSGENDPVTPPEYADVALAGFEFSHHTVGPKQGHGLIARGCVRRLAARFLDDEEPFPVEDECVDRLTAMPFFIDFNGPAE